MTCIPVILLSRTYFMDFKLTFSYCLLSYRCIFSARKRIYEVWYKNRIKIRVSNFRSFAKIHLYQKQILGIMSHKKLTMVCPKSIFWKVKICKYLQNWLKCYKVTFSSTTLFNIKFSQNFPDKTSCYFIFLFLKITRWLKECFSNYSKKWFFAYFDCWTPCLCFFNISTFIETELILTI